MESDDKIKKTLAACVADLAHGFLAAGGLSSVGRGLFEITDIQCPDDKDLESTMNTWAKL